MHMYICMFAHADIDTYRSIDCNNYFVGKLIALVCNRPRGLDELGHAFVHDVRCASLPIYAVPRAGLLAQSEDFATVRAAMNTSLASDYTAASEYARIFESVRPIYNFTVKVEGQMSPIISRGPDDSSGENCT